MAVPEELVELERLIKGFGQKLLTLRTKHKDTVAARNKLVVDIQQAEIEQSALVQHKAEILTADVIDMWAYADVRVELADTSDWLMEAQIKRLQHEQLLKDINDEIPSIEEELGRIRAEHADWGEVIAFRPRTRD